MSLAIAPVSPPIVTERPKDASAIDALILRAFGPGRFAKAAERLREGREPCFELSFVAWDGGRIVGCVRQWTVKVGQAPSIFLGPIAVEPAYRSQGVGAALIERACEAAARGGHASIVLVGDMPLFGPHGFAPASRVILPGPVDRTRVLARALQPGADLALEGLITAA